MQSRYPGHQTGTVTAFRFGGFLNCTAAGRVLERGYQGETGAVGPNRALRASSPQAPYSSLPPKGESSLILLRLLSPRKASRLPWGPLFLASFAYFPSLESRPPEASSPQVPYHSLCRLRQSSLIPLRLLSPRKASRLPRGPFSCGFWVLFAGEKYLPEGYSLASLKWTDGFPLIRPLRGHLPPLGEGLGKCSL